MRTGRIRSALLGLVVGRAVPDLRIHRVERLVGSPQTRDVEIRRQGRVEDPLLKLLHDLPPLFLLALGVRRDLFVDGLSRPVVVQRVGPTIGAALLELLANLADRLRHFGPCLVRAFPVGDGLRVLGQHLDLREGGLVEEGDLLEDDGDHHGLAEGVQLQGLHHLLLIAVVRIDEIRAHQEEDDLRGFEALVDLALPPSSGPDLAVVPGGDDARPLEHAELLLELVDEPLVFVRVAVEDADLSFRRQGWEDHFASGIGQADSIGIPPTPSAHTISFTLSSSTVKAILPRFGVPLASDSASLTACLAVTFGGARGSTTASTRTGPGWASASSSTAPQRAGS